MSAVSLFFHSCQQRTVPEFTWTVPQTRIRVFACAHPTSENSIHVIQTNRFLASVEPKYAPRYSFGWLNVTFEPIFSQTWQRQHNPKRSSGAEQQERLCILHGPDFSQLFLLQTVLLESRISAALSEFKKRLVPDGLCQCHFIYRAQLKQQLLTNVLYILPVVLVKTQYKQTHTINN